MNSKDPDGCWLITIKNATFPVIKHPKILQNKIKNA